MTAEWKTIDSAPKDLPILIAARTKRGTWRLSLVKWGKPFWGRAGWFTEGGVRSYVVEPTHWCGLEAPDA